MMAPRFVWKGQWIMAASVLFTFPCRGIDISAVLPTEVCAGKPDEHNSGRVHGCHGADSEQICSLCRVGFWCSWKVYLLLRRHPGCHLQGHHWRVWLVYAICVFVSLAPCNSKWHLSLISLPIYLNSCSEGKCFGISEWRGWRLGPGLGVPQPVLYWQPQGNAECHQCQKLPVPKNSSEKLEASSCHCCPSKQGVRWAAVFKIVFYSLKWCLVMSSLDVNFAAAWRYLKWVICASWETTGLCAAEYLVGRF